MSLCVSAYIGRSTGNRQEGVLYEVGETQTHDHPSVRDWTSLFMWILYNILDRMWILWYVLFLQQKEESLGQKLELREQRSLFQLRHRGNKTLL